MLDAPSEEAAETSPWTNIPLPLRHNVATSVPQRKRGTGSPCPNAQCYQSGLEGSVAMRRSPFAAHLTGFWQHCALGCGAVPGVDTAKQGKGNGENIVHRDKGNIVHWGVGKGCALRCGKRTVETRTQMPVVRGIIANADQEFSTFHFWPRPPIYSTYFVVALIWFRCTIK